MSTASKRRQAEREARQGEGHQQKIDVGNPASSHNPSDSDRVNGGQPRQGITRKQYITKQDILDLLQYERDTGYRFNRMPNDEFIAQLRGDEQMPIAAAYIHNGIEVRVMFMAPDKTEVFLDMPFDRYFHVDRTVLPSFPQFDPPRKGVNVVRILSNADVVSLKKHWWGQRTAKTIKLMEDTQSLRTGEFDELRSDNSVLSQCWTGTNFTPHRIRIPIERYFALPKQEIPWPGWTASDNKDAA